MTEQFCPLKANHIFFFFFFGLPSVYDSTNLRQNPSNIGLSLLSLCCCGTCRLVSGRLFIGRCRGGWLRSSRWFTGCCSGWLRSSRWLTGCCSGWLRSGRWLKSACSCRFTGRRSCKLRSSRLTSSSSGGRGLSSRRSRKRRGSRIRTRRGGRR